MQETNTYKKMVNEKTTNFPDMVILHHSSGTDSNPLLDTSHHTAEIMEAQHLSNGWRGLGYHYVIHKNGDIWKGRPEHVEGSHTVGKNKVSIGICLAGNFDATLPTKEQEASLKTLLKDIQKRYPKVGDNIFPHRKYANKTCYGSKLTDTWGLNLLRLPLSQEPKIDKEKLLTKLEELRVLISKLV